MTTELEKVLTIDGRGRPKKAILLLELITKHGIEAVLAEIKKLGERKAF
jgi:hypothetical protein